MEEEIENSSILPRSCDKFENVEEEIENVEVDGDGREDVLLRGDRELVVATHHHLGGGGDIVYQGKYILIYFR